MTVGAYEAKTHLPALLERVEKGERITITRHGHAIAELVPAGAANRPSVKDAIQELKRLRKGRSLKGITIRELIEEGRRW